MPGETKSTTMLQALHIERFRGLPTLDLEHLARVNLIGGRNNSGKTAVLEALFLLLGAGELSILLRMAQARAGTPLKLSERAVREILWRPLFHDLRDDLPIRISADHGEDQSSSLSLRVEQPGTASLVREGEDLEPAGPESVLVADFAAEPVGTWSVTMRGLKFDRPRGSPIHSSFFLPATWRLTPVEMAEKFGKLQMANATSEFVSVLRLLEPRLEGVEPIVVAGVPTLFAVLSGGRKQPLHILGEGSLRLATILLLISNAPGGCVLVDEIENGLHYSALPALWKGLQGACTRYGVQLFATTHSWECLQAAREALGLDPEAFLYYRLERRGDRVVPVCVEPDDLERAAELGLEMR